MSRSELAQRRQRLQRKLAASFEGWHSGRVDRLAQALRAVERELETTTAVQSAQHHSGERNMFRLLSVVTLGAAALTSLSACVVVPPHAYAPRYVHDRDRDGIPNRHDHDRDGDGVPNRYDRYPDNPYRR